MVLAGVHNTRTHTHIHRTKTRHINEERGGLSNSVSDPIMMISKEQRTSNVFLVHEIHVQFPASSVDFQHDLKPFFGTELPTDDGFHDSNFAWPQLRHTGTTHGYTWLVYQQYI